MRRCLRQQVQLNLASKYCSSRLLRISRRCSSLRDGVTSWTGTTWSRKATSLASSYRITSIMMQWRGRRSWLELKSMGITLGLSVHMTFRRALSISIRSSRKVQLRRTNMKCLHSPWITSSLRSSSPSSKARQKKLLAWCWSNSMLNKRVSKKSIWLNSWNDNTRNLRQSFPSQKKFRARLAAQYLFKSHRWMSKRTIGSPKKPQVNTSL